MGASAPHLLQRPFHPSCAPCSYSGWRQIQHDSRRWAVASASSCRTVATVSSIRFPVLVTLVQFRVSSTPELHVSSQGSVRRLRTFLAGGIFPEL